MIHDDNLPPEVQEIEIQKLTIWDFSFEEPGPLIVTDSQGRDIIVWGDDLQEHPNKNSKYQQIQVFYCGQTWWISENAYFPA